MMMDDEYFMREAIKEAKKAKVQGEWPYYQQKQFALEITSGVLEDECARIYKEAHPKGKLAVIG